MSRILGLVDALFRAEPREWYKNTISPYVSNLLDGIIHAGDSVADRANNAYHFAQDFHDGHRHMEGLGLWDRYRGNALLIEIEHDPMVSFSLSEASGGFSSSGAHDSYTNKNILQLVLRPGASIGLRSDDQTILIAIKQFSSRKASAILIKKGEPDRRYTFDLRPHPQSLNELWPAIDSLGLRFRATILPRKNHAQIVSGFYRHLR